MTSSPTSAGGMARAWMGVGVENPAALTARSDAGDRPRVVKSVAETGSVDTDEAFFVEQDGPAGRKDTHQHGARARKAAAGSRNASSLNSPVAEKRIFSANEHFEPLWAGWICRILRAR